MRIGELFAGYGGLGMGVKSVLGGEVAWVSEFDPAPSRILAHRFPDAPNLGDITQVDWSHAPPVDVLTGGFPCQDVSLAGRRAGITSGTRSGLWSEFAHAIDQIRPRLVVIENVRGLLSAKADGPVESDPWGVGDGATGSVVNAFGVVLGDLASLGYDAEWCGVRAADAGAPHGRFRVFCVAYPHGSTATRQPNAQGRQEVRGIASGWGSEGSRRRIAVEDANLAARGERWLAAPGETESGRARANARGRSGTPAGHADDTGLEGRPLRGERPNERTARADGVGNRWGNYEPAIRRWEHLTGRTAPAPTTGDGKNGGHRLSARFVEWMMGLPDGWVTSPDIGLTRTEQLKALGNGVVPQQAALALRTLLEAA